MYRFIQLEIGQHATVDAPLVLDLVAAAARTHLTTGGRILDLGCGAGNFTLKVMQATGPLACDLVDLSRPMLERATQRVREAGATTVRAHQADLRRPDFQEDSFDAICREPCCTTCATSLNGATFSGNLWRWLKRGGRLYVADLVTFDDPQVQALVWKRYGEYLEGIGGQDYGNASSKLSNRRTLPDRCHAKSPRCGRRDLLQRRLHRSAFCVLLAGSNPALALSPRAASYVSFAPTR